MGDPAPRVSVIVPVYNAEAYLRQTIESLLGQTLRALEFILVDDHSTDRSPDIIREYAAKDQRIVLLSNEVNLRAGASRNRGLQAARGEYVHFLDADDYLAPDAFEVLYTAAADAGADLVKAKSYAVDFHTEELIPNAWYSLDALAPEDFGRVTRFSEMPEKFVRLAVTPWSGIYRRAFLTENGIAFNRLVCVNDRSFYAEVIIKAESVLFLDHYFIYHRVNNPGSLVGVRARNFHCHFDSYALILSHCAGLSQRERFLILENEVQDMFVWYRKYQREHVLEGEIFSQMKNFMEGLDVSVFGEQLEQCRWYKSYLAIRKRSTFGPEKKAPLPVRLWWYLREHGLVKTLRLILGKLRRGLSLHRG